MNGSPPCRARHGNARGASHDTSGPRAEGRRCKPAVPRKRADNRNEPVTGEPCAWHGEMYPRSQNEEQCWAGVRWNRASMDREHPWIRDAFVSLLLRNATHIRAGNAPCQVSNTSNIRRGSGHTTTLSGHRLLLGQHGQEHRHLPPSRRKQESQEQQTATEANNKASWVACGRTNSAETLCIS